MSLRQRLVMLQVVLAGALALVGLLVIESMQRALMSDADDILAVRAASVAAEVQAMQGRPSRSGIPAGLRLDPRFAEEVGGSGVYVQVSTPDGNVVRTSRNLSGGQLPVVTAEHLPAKSDDGVFSTVTVGADRIRLLSLRVGPSTDPMAVVQVGVSLHQIDTAIRGLVRLIVLGGGAGLLGAMLATWLLVGRFLAPLERIARTAEYIAESGDANTPVPSASGGEVAALSRSLNRMVDRLRGLIRSQQQLLADTSHELRNPLTVIRTNLSMLRRDLPETVRSEIVDESEAEAGRMSRLVSDLLLLAQLDTGQGIEQAPVRLDQVVPSVVGAVRNAYPDRIITVRLPVVPAILLGDSDRLRQVLSNLLENAIRYSPAETDVDVSLDVAGDHVELAVQDRGSGIAPDHLPHIFDRFYRVDKARSRSTGGAGLGLAIVREIVEAHGGTVSASSEPGRGTRFSVLLPVERSWSTGQLERAPVAASADPLPHRSAAT